MSEAGNPVLEIFDHMVPDDGRYSVTDVALFWNMNDGPSPGIVDVTVAFFPLDAIILEIGLPPSQAHKFWDAWAKWNKPFLKSAGRITDDWMKGDLRSTPEGWFGQWLLLDGFASDFEQLSALREMCKIQECEWARRMTYEVSRREAEGL